MVNIQPQQDFLYKIIGEQYVQLLVLKENYMKLQNRYNEINKEILDENKDGEV